MEFAMEMLTEIIIVLSFIWLPLVILCSVLWIRGISRSDRDEKKKKKKKIIPTVLFTVSALLMSMLLFNAFIRPESTASRISEEDILKLAKSVVQEEYDYETFLHEYQSEKALSKGVFKDEPGDASFYKHIIDGAYVTINSFPSLDQYGFGFEQGYSCYEFATEDEAKSVFKSISIYYDNDENTRTYIEQGYQVCVSPVIFRASFGSGLHTYKTFSITIQYGNKIVSIGETSNLEKLRLNKVIKEEKVFKKQAQA